MTNQLTFEESLKPFFGNSNAANHFVAANYFAADDFTMAPNSSNAPETILSTVAANVMLAENYNNRNGMASNDIHHQYVDFIVRTALFHREIDRSTGMGSGLASVGQQIKNSIPVAMGRPLNMTAFGGLMMGAVNMGRGVGRAAGGEVISLNNLGVVANNNNFYDYIIGVLLLATYGADNPNELINDLNTLPARNIGLGAPATVMNIPDVVRNLVGTCSNANPIINNSGDICIYAYLSQPTSQNARDTIDAIVQRNGLTMATIAPQLENEMTSRLMGFLRTMISTIGPNVIFNAWQNTTKAGLINDLKNIFDAARKKPELQNALANTMVNGMVDVIKKNLNTQVNTTAIQGQRGSYKTLVDNAEASNLFDNVFNQKWLEIDGQARMFYRKHLHVFAKNRQTTGLTANETGWRDLMANDAEPVNITVPRDYLRLNLMKTDAGAADPLFVGTLPFVPVNHIDKIWYTDSNGNVTHIPHGDISVDTLKQIYLCVYKNDTAVNTPTTCQVGSHVLSLPSDWSVVVNDASDFDLNDIEIIRAHIKNNKDPQLAVAQHTPDFNNLFAEDMVTRISYFRDNGGMYRMENGKRIDYSSDKAITMDNCAGTQLKGDRSKCAKFVKDCIITGKPEDLTRCLGDLKNENMFNVALKEMDGVDPSVAVKIINTFNIGYENYADERYGNITRPRCFEDWIKDSSALKSSVRDVIQKNENLAAYLKGIICFVRSNPAILNTNLHIETNGNVTKSNEPADKYMTALGISFYNKPNPALEAAQGLSLLGTSVYRPAANIGALPFTNAVMGPSYMTAPIVGGLMSGGGSYIDSIRRKILRKELSSDLAQSVIQKAIVDLKASGWKLEDTNIADINDGIKTLATVEKRIFELHNVIRIFTNLTRFFKATGCNVPASIQRTVSINDIRSRKDTLEYLTKNLNDLQTCVGNNLSHQNTVVAGLAKQFASLFETTAGK